MSFLKFTRHVEWWEYKLPPLLSVAYATVIFCDYPVEQAIWKILLLLLAIVVGAIYVSVINDLSDIEEDRIAGKRNSMASIPPFLKISILFTVMLAALLFSYLLAPDWISIFFYGLAYLAFSLYSIRPFRFKERGMLGVACDAMGAHLFPSLLMTSNLIHMMDQEVNAGWYIGVGGWSFLYGLRGILWHQFHDRENDLKSGTSTYATGKDPDKFQFFEMIIFFLEVVAFSVFVSYFFDITIISGLLLYITLVLIRVFVFKRKLRFIIAHKSEYYQLLMNDFYIVFLPVALLVRIGVDQSFGWIILVCHLVLFPLNALAALKDYLFGFKRILSKIYRKCVLHI